jgi:hypothetical protein
MQEKHMATDLVELHGRCGQRFAPLVAGVGPKQWHDDSLSRSGTCQGVAVLNERLPADPPSSGGKIWS